MSLKRPSLRSSGNRGIDLVAEHRSYPTNSYFQVLYILEYQVVRLKLQHYLALDHSSVLQVLGDGKQLGEAALMTVLVGIKGLEGLRYICSESVS